MMRVFALVSLMLVPAAALAACGSSNAADLFNGGGSSTDGGASESDATTGTGPETPGADAGPGDGGGKKKDGGGNPQQDGGPQPDDGGSTPDTSTPADPGIYCGVDQSSHPVYCDVSSQACCIRDTNGSLTFDCRAKGQVCSNGLTVPCSDQADCNGQICCATYNKIMSGYDKVECKSSCGADFATTTEYRLCDPDAAVDECIAAGGTCQPSTAIDGWYLCKK